MTLDIAPPASLYPDYVSPGPVQNLGAPWKLCGFTGGLDSNSPVLVTFDNVQTHESMMIKEGDSKNGITVLDADWETKEVVVEIDGNRFTLNLGLPR